MPDLTQADLPFPLHVDHYTSRKTFLRRRDLCTFSGCLRRLCADSSHGNFPKTGVVQLRRRGGGVYPGGAESRLYGV